MQVWCVWVYCSHSLSTSLSLFLDPGDDTLRLDRYTQQEKHSRLFFMFTILVTIRALYHQSFFKTYEYCTWGENATSYRIQQRLTEEKRIVLKVHKGNTTAQREISLSFAIKQNSEQRVGTGGFWFRFFFGGGVYSFTKYGNTDINAK